LFFYIDGSIKFRIGTWGKDTGGKSSNWREFENIVETIEEEDITGTLKDLIIYLATDNLTVESALYKGNSSSEKLFDLVVHMRQAEMCSGGQI